MEDLSMTQEDLIRHGKAIQRLMDDREVQRLLEALDQMYYKQWKAAKTPEERELLSVKASALGDLKHGLEAAVSVGQHEAAALEKAEQEAERARNRH